MALKIQETFQVDAPPARVWTFLLDPHQVVQCLPGAELLEVEDEQTFLGRVKVKVGPVKTGYKGRARFVELDEEGRRIRMSGEGQETGGSGSAKMIMSSELVELPDGGCEVRVQVDMDVVGRIVQFGRGMIEEVSRQLFRQFAECVRGRLAQPEEELGAEPLAEPEPAVAASSGEVTAVATEPHGAATTTPSAPTRPRPAAEPAPVSALPLLFRALWTMIRRFFGRLLGRG